MIRPKRQYQELWEEIKKKHPKEVWVESPPELHRRVIKAVRKEKSVDLAPSVRFYKLSARVYESKIGFKLKPYRQREKLGRLL